MADIKTGLGWSDAQWERVNSAVTEAFGKASVAGAFLPCYGPLPEAAEYVRDEKFTETGATVRIADDTTLKLFNLTVNVVLSSEQVAEEALSSALLAFRRAANTLAQVEDDLVFNGFNKNVARTGRTASIVVTHPDTLEGLAEVNRGSKTKLRTKGGDVGEKLVTAVVKAISDLEDDSHSGPFACVLGSNLFEEAHKPREKSMVLPADRITPLLNGPLFRSGQMDEDSGIVVSLAASAIDIVVATPPRAQFLQLTADAKYLFRVYEKFMLRIKDPTAVQPL
jgi:uncharacterized linocin/CFP29 family protein